MKSTLFVLTNFILMASVGWGQSTPSNLTVQTFSDKLRQTPFKTVLDVRTAPEVVDGMLPGAINIDFFTPDFTSQLGRLDKTRPVFVYCAVGGRSGKAARQLQQAGFKTVYNLAGGMQAWQQAGYVTVKKKP
ncbi:rhodanese-like domain-containing protein [Spirosoma spitsbergense]|jgi:phage shock protein E|uniref:rhodanese-like domain-containing protein n=1 Tax=Spirosoma spitsbergense TaxID=431554 RepID=UPI000360CCDD|nr:rhodanese-like domain-containing protein [Spirosoma spitsbergense]